MNKKVFVLSNQLSDADWLNMEKVNNLDDADVLYIHGYTDIHPSNYNSEKLVQVGKFTSARLEVDAEHIQIYKKAVIGRKVIIGSNRGLHLIATQLGAGLIQHMQHPMKHRIVMYDKSQMVVNSYHHQLVSLLRLNSIMFQLIGYAECLSPFYLNGYDKGYSAFTKTENGTIIDPEIIHFPTIKGLGFQFNPNEFPVGSVSYKICCGLVNRLLDGKLLNGLKLKVPINELIDNNFEFTKEDVNKLIELEETIYEIQ